MVRGSAVARRIRRALVVCALVAGVAAMHHVGTATPDVATAPPTAVAAAAVHSLVDAGGLSTGAVTDHHAGAEPARATGPAAAAPAATTAGHPADHAATHGPTGAGHDLLHLCLAVVVSAALALLGWLLVRHGVLRWVVRRWSGALPGRALLRPPRAVLGRSLLLSVCVMRT
jgi:hypothetical protein